MTPSLEKLVNSFASLPGIGRKSAARLAYRVIEMSEDEVKTFVSSIVEAKKSVHLCSVCQAYSEDDVCSVCSNEHRSLDTIIVVEDNKALEAIEETHEYNGKYHVLHGVISPVDGIGPEQLKIKELLHRLDDNVNEVIIATNPSVEGEATAMYLGRLIKPFEKKVTRLAYGLPVGGTLEYADSVTLMKAIEGRTEV
ncbi:MAG: recombination protein RecR [Clostridia bacterium]|nr:recombination protein RecR [Clostridia bacterium]